MARLVLDPACVLSAWEQMGGNAFSSDDFPLDDPSAITLDLSGWEARLKPAATLPPPPPAPVETNIFAPFFNPAEFGLSFIPSCCAAPPAVAPVSCGAGGGATSDSTAQVVPHCPASSAGICSAEDGPDGTLLGSAATHFDDDCVMSLQFSDMEAAVLSASPTSSCEAGVVPDFQGGAELLSRAHHNQGQTATSAPMSLTAATATAAPVAPGACAFFVPVGCGADAGGGAWGGQSASCGLQTCGKEEPLPVGDLGPQQPAVVEGPVDAPASRRQAASQHQTAPQQAKQAPAQPPAPLATRGSAASAAGAAAAASVPGGAVPYTRTRAECLERYREKKARRLYTKKIRYQLRKINADKRPRIKGRFVKKEELEEFLAAQRGSGPTAAADGDDPFTFDGMAFESDEE